MKSFADLLYEAADLLHEQIPVAEKQSRYNAVRDMTELLGRINDALTTSNGDVLTPEQLSRITKKYDRTGTFFADIYALADSHEAMRRALDTNASICERYAARWMPMDPEFDEHYTMWWKGGIKAEPMTADEISWFETYRNKQADSRGQMIDIDHHEQDATEVDDNIHITGRED